MISIKDKKDCCGCSACANICPKGAITMEPDNLGFLYPQIDVDKCIDCGLCDKVCAFNDNYDKSLNLERPITYAGRHKDLNEVKTSQSGAAFIALSDYVLDLGGVVYGVGYLDNFHVVHKRAETKEQRDEFKGSKYVQSDLNTVFSQVKNDLKRGRIVLFSGTPCQTSGLNSFVGKRLRENLYLVDLICHGVPSPYLWRDYLKFLEKKENHKIIKTNFRDKRKTGWHGHIESFLFSNNKLKFGNSYTFLFYSHIALRYSCGDCHFTNLCRPSDITISDAWGIEKSKISYLASDNVGYSAFMINTEKGKNLFDAIKNNIEYKPFDIKDFAQPNLFKPTTLHPKRKEFEEVYPTLSLSDLMDRYGNTSLYYRFIVMPKKSIRNFISMMLPTPLKKRIKEIIKRKK